MCHIKHLWPPDIVSFSTHSVFSPHKRTNWGRNEEKMHGVGIGGGGQKMCVQGGGVGLL